jgi:hypothetical protein
MSAIEKVSQLSHRIFNTSLTEKNVARSSNPFAASNFQKNILTEDVFESTKKNEGKNISFSSLSASSKRLYSTFVGSISNLGSRISEGIESVAAFCGRMKDGIVDTWNKIQEIGQTEIKLDGAKELLSRDITSFFKGGKEREISKMSKMNPHLEVKPMLVDALSALESDLAIVA